MRNWLARFRFVIALAGPLATIALLPPVAAQDEAYNAALDTLFAQLHSAPDEARARIIADQIWVHWTNPADAALAARMQDILAQSQRVNSPALLALLDALVTDYPDYAEGWNQRATVHYLLRNFEQSLADIDRVLALEPRHFGALAGRAMIYREQGKHDLALQDMIAALAIHPFLGERALFPELSDLIQA